MDRHHRYALGNGVGDNMRRAAGTGTRHAVPNGDQKVGLTHDDVTYRCITLVAPVGGERARLTAGMYGPVGQDHNGIGCLELCTHARRVVRTMECLCIGIDGKRKDGLKTPAQSGRYRAFGERRDGYLIGAIGQRADQRNFALLTGKGWTLRASQPRLDVIEDNRYRLMDGVGIEGPAAVQAVTAYARAQVTARARRQGQQIGQPIALAHAYSLKGCSLMQLSILRIQ